MNSRVGRTRPPGSGLEQRDGLRGKTAFTDDAKVDP